MTLPLVLGSYRCPWPSSDKSRSVILHLLPVHHHEGIQFYLEIWDETQDTLTKEATSPPFELLSDPKAPLRPEAYAALQISLALAQQHVFASSVDALLYVFWWRQLVDHDLFRAWVFERFPAYQEMILRVFGPDFPKERP